MRNYYSVSTTLNVDERIEKLLQKNQTKMLETLKSRLLIQTSWHRVQKLLAAFWAVYGLRWKFIQIQTQQVWIFRIFLLYARPPTTLRKTYIHGLSQLKSRKMIIIFFASLGKNKYLRMSLLQSRCKTNLWKHRFFSKKRNAVTSS